MNPSLRRFAAALCLASSAACAPVSVASPGRSSAAGTRWLDRAEIAELQVSSALDVVRRLRPQWLRRRGNVSLAIPSGVVVYVNDMQYGGPESLRDIPADAVSSMEFLTGIAATQRWGTNHVHGAILVRTG